MFITGDNNLFALLMQVVKCMEKFKLRCFLTFNKLNIIYKKDIHCSIFISEVLTGSRMFIFAVTDCVYDFIGKSLTCNINDFFRFIMLQNVVCNCMHQMRLSKTCTSIYKKRIVSVTGFFCNL